MAKLKSHRERDTSSALIRDQKPVIFIVDAAYYFSILQQPRGRTTLRNLTIKDLLDSLYYRY